MLYCLNLHHEVYVESVVCTTVVFSDIGSVFYCRTCQSLGRHCPRLLRLDLESCNAITDTSLIAIGSVVIHSHIHFVF